MGTHHLAETLSNMGTKDAKWFSESVLGQTTEVTQGRNVQRDCFRVLTDCGGQNQSETKRALLTPDEVANIAENELLVKFPQRPPARLTQRRFYDDHEVKRRAPAKGVSWIPPLGLPRKDGPLEPPTFDDATGDEEDAAGVVQAATPDVGPALDEAAALVDELGEYDEAEAFMASVSGC